MEHRIDRRGPLLDPDGRLREPGYATDLLLEYRRGDIRAHPFRIKEWDYYLVLCDSHALALTIADNGYMGLLSVSLLDFLSPSQRTVSRMIAFPMGRLSLPCSSAEGDVSVESGGISLSFAHRDGARELRAHVPRFQGTEPLTAHVRLTHPPRDTMVIATPFRENPRAFYYNQKINCLRAEGEALVGARRYAFSPGDSFGTLDWGRGVWTYRNTWYWGSCSGLVEGTPFGMNIGFGFGDTAAATENMLFWDGTAHKLARVGLDIPTTNGREDFLRPWRVFDDRKRLSLDFVPIVDRASRTSLGLLSSDQHQVFGRFTGSAALDDGRVVRLEGMAGFVEKVSNRW